MLCQLLGFQHSLHVDPHVERSWKQHREKRGKSEMWEWQNYRHLLRKITAFVALLICFLNSQRALTAVLLSWDRISWYASTHAKGIAHCFSFYVRSSYMVIGLFDREESEPPSNFYLISAHTLRRHSRIKANNLLLQTTYIFRATKQTFRNSLPATSDVNKCQLTLLAHTNFKAFLCSSKFV